MKSKGYIEGLRDGLTYLIIGLMLGAALTVLSPYNRSGEAIGPIPCEPLDPPTYEVAPPPERGG